MRADAQPYLGPRPRCRGRRHDGWLGDPASSGAAARSFKAGQHDGVATGGFREPAAVDQL